MGRVWRATDVVLHREVAIKELVPPPGLTAGERQEMRERSLREARAIARLNNINVVRVFDVLRTDADPWIGMEYVPSRSLQDTLAADGPYSPVRTAEIGLGVLNALRAAHRAGVVHRDVKPGNVLIGADGRVVLTDFGLATVPGDPNVTRTGLVLGSPAYIAPERARDGSAGPAADLWSLGATLYAAVEGASPFARPSAIATLAALATENPPPARNAGPMKPVLNGLLRKDPTHRINAEEAERLLLRAAGRRSKLSFPMSPTMRRPGVGRDRSALTSGTSSAPVVPGPRPPVARPSGRTVTPAPGRPAGPSQPPVTPGRPSAGEGRPRFTPGKAQVGRPAADTPTRVDTPKVDTPRLDATRVDGPKIDATRVDGPPVQDDRTTVFGTRSGAPTPPGQTSTPDSPRSGPHASGGLSRTSRGGQAGFTAADVAANRRGTAAPEHEKSLADATALLPRVKPGEQPDPTTKISPAKEPKAPPVDQTTKISEPVDKTTRIATPVARPAKSPAPVDKTTKISEPPADRTTRIPEPATKPEPAKPANATPAKAERAESAPAKAESAKSESAKAENAEVKSAQPGSVQARSVEAGTTNAGAAEAGTAEAGAANDGTAEAGAANAGTAEAGAANAGTAEAGAANAGTAEAGAANAGTANAGTANAGTAGDGSAKARSANAGTAGAGSANAGVANAGTEAGAVEAGAVEAGIAEAGSGEAGSTEAGSANAGSAAAGTAESETAKAGSANAGSANAGSAAAGTAKAGSAKAGSANAGSAAAGTAKARSGEAGSAEAGSAKAGTAEAGSAGAGGGEAGSADAGGIRAGGSTAASAAVENSVSDNASTNTTRHDGAGKTGKPAVVDATQVVSPAKKLPAQPKRVDDKAKPGKSVTDDAPAKTTAMRRGATDATVLVPAEHDPEPMPAFNRSSRPAWTPMPVRQSPGVTVFGTRLTYGQAAVAGGILLLIVVLVVVLIGVLNNDGDQDNGNQARQPVAPPASAGGPSQQPGKAPATSSTPSPKPSSAPPSSPAGLTLPTTWRVYSDGSGYKVPLPKSADISQDGSETRIRWNNRLLLIDQSDDPKPDALADWQQQERDRAGRDYRNYNKVRLQSVSNYFKQAADWEFFYTTSTGNEQHAVKRNIIVSDDQAYSISWYVSPDDWNASQADLKLIYQGFQPKK